MPDTITQPDVNAYRIPRQPDLADVVPAIEDEFAQYRYAETVLSPDPQETGMPASPIREGGGPVNAVETEKPETLVYATDTGREFTYPSDHHAVLNEASAGVASVYAATEATGREQLAQQEAHARMANQTADALTHTVTTMREQALEAVADEEPLKRGKFGLAA